MNALYSLQIEFQHANRKHWYVAWISAELEPILTAARWCKEPHRIVVVTVEEEGEEK